MAFFFGTVEMLQYEDRSIYAMLFFFALIYLLVGIMNILIALLTNSSYLVVFSYSAVLLIVAIVVMVLTGSLYRKNVLRQRRVRSKTVPQLLNGYFYSVRVYGDVSNKKGIRNRTFAREKLLDLRSDRAELKKRDPEIENLAITAVYDQDDKKREAASQELINRFGEEAFPPLNERLYKSGF